MIASNRIDTPEVAEAVLAEGAADMLSLARPFPADAHFVKNAAGGRAADLAPFDEIVVATGVLPRRPAIPGADLPHVASHADILSGAVVAGARVAVLGAGGIGVDVAAFLVTGESAARDPVLWRREWGVADPARMRGGLAEPRPAPPLRQVTLLQRSPGRPGRGLGRTTGWIHRAHLRRKGVVQLGGVTCEEVLPGGLRIITGPQGADPRLIAADAVVLCTGQEPERALAAALAAAGLRGRRIGGAAGAAELDAQRAIDEGTRLGAAL